MRRLLSARYRFTVLSFPQGRERRAPPVDTQPTQTPCSHAGPCRFPFRQCDGGPSYIREFVDVGDNEWGL